MLVKQAIHAAFMQQSHLEIRAKNAIADHDVVTIQGIPELSQQGHFAGPFARIGSQRGLEDRPGGHAKEHDKTDHRKPESRFLSVGLGIFRLIGRCVGSGHGAAIDDASGSIFPFQGFWSVLGKGVAGALSEGLESVFGESLSCFAVGSVIHPCAIDNNRVRSIGSGLEPRRKRLTVCAIIEKWDVSHICGASAGNALSSPSWVASNRWPSCAAPPVPSCIYVLSACADRFCNKAISVARDRVFVDPCSNPICLTTTKRSNEDTYCMVADKIVLCDNGHSLRTGCAVIISYV